MPIIDLQKRARELGRIRIGQAIPITKKNGDPGTRPEKLDRFRLTSASKPLLEKVAKLYGGEVVEWTPQGGGPQQWEVLTTAARIPVMVPPQPVTQWLELWSGGGCQRRCDGQTEIIGDRPCVCALADERVCRPTTRLNVVLRDVEGIGVWRLESHGYYAASELPDVAGFLANAGGYVEAWLALEERVIRKEGEKPKRFMVPTLEVDVTPAQLMAGHGGIAAPQVEGPVVRQQIEAGPAAAVPEHLAGYHADLAKAETPADCMDIYTRAKRAGHLEDAAGLALYQAIGERGRALAAAPSPQPVAATEAKAAEENPDVLWQQILTAAGELDLTTSQIEAEFAAANGGTTPETASAGELRVFLESLRSREAVEAVPA